MLNAHPDVAVAPETFFMRHFWEQRDAYGDLSEDAVLDYLIDDLVATPAFERMGLNAEAIRDVVHRAGHRWSKIFLVLLWRFAERRNAQFVGEKTPNHVLFLPTLCRWYPDARFVHLVQDPRAVPNPWRTVPWSLGYRWRDAEVWDEFVRAGRRAEEVGERVHSLHFEALVRSPEEELRAVCDHLDLPYDGQMLAFHEQESATVDVEREPWKERATDPIDPSVADRWRDELSVHAQAQVEMVAGGEMERWGYTVECSTWHRRVAALRRYVERPVWKFGLVLEELWGEGDASGGALSEREGPITVGFLHVGHSQHGVRRYGQVLAEGARSHLKSVRVLEASIEWTDNPRRDAGQLQEAVRTLEAAEIVHVQYEVRSWGESVRALINVFQFAALCDAEVVVTVHDARDGYAPWSIVRRLLEQSRFFSGGTEPRAGTKGKAGSSTDAEWGQSLTNAAWKGLRFLVQEVCITLSTLRLTQRAARVLVCTSEEAWRLGGLVEDKRVTVIPHFVEERPRHFDRSEAKAHLDLEGRRVVSVLGFITRQKGYDLVVEALPHLPNDVVALFVGRPGPRNQDYAEGLRARASDLGTDSRLRVTGYVQEDELDRYLAATDLALCPFREASASGSLSTWIAAERPVLASDLPLFSEYNERVPESIATFHPYTPERLATRTEKILERPKEEVQPRLQALRESLSVPEIVAQHHEVYRRVLEESSDLATGQ
jgi:glycosyltransferase involved in cell wall biosynthesis